MKLLHTSDWHVGKTLKGQSTGWTSSAPVLAADRRHRPRPSSPTRCSSPATSTTPPRPSAEAQQLVVQALLGLRDTGAEVIAIAGNHDNGADLRRATGRCATPPGSPWSAAVRTADRGRRDQLRRPVHRRAGATSRCCRSCPSGTRSAPPS